METIVALNIEKICRVCLSECELAYSIYSEVYEEQIIEGHDTVYIHQMLMSISLMKMEPNDGLPSLICTKCLENAHAAFKFQKQCNQSETLLDAYLKQTLEATEDPLKLNAEDFLVVKDDNNSPEPDNDVLEEETADCGGPLKASTTPKSKKDHRCSICEKSFPFATALKVHIRTHTGEQPYACKICNKKYRQSGSLTAHMRVHTGQRPFLCSVCGAGFRQAADLGYHTRFHKKEKPYMCNICGKTMTIQSHLVQHLRLHTGEKPFKCTQCDKAFPSSTRLKRHAIIHTDLKPHVCDVCHKSFNRRSSLMTHLKTHSDERPHVCHVCAKAFKQYYSLKAHLLSHSSEKS